MAVNNSGKPPPNSLNSDDHFGLADLGRIRDQYYTESAATRGARKRGQAAQGHLADLEEAERQIPGWMTLPENQKSFIKHSRTVENVNSRLNIYQEAKEERLNDQATNIIGRKFSSSAVNSYIGRHSNSLEAQVSGMAISGQGYTSLDAQRRQITSQMHGLRQDAMSAAGTYIGENGINNNAQSVLDSGAGQMKDLAKQLIPITLAMQQLKQQGLDPKGRQEELARIGNKAAGTLHANNLQAEMQSGKGMGAFSMAELKKKEAEAAEKLIKAMDALKNSVGKTTDELTELNKEAETAAEEYKKLNEAKGAKEKDGGGNKYETIKMIAGTIMEVLDLGTSMYSNVAINQPMQMVSNTAAAANLENQKYQSWHAALAGNIHERMNLDWNDARTFGNTMANAQSNVHTLRTANNVTGLALGVGQVGVSVYNGVTSGGGAISGVNPVEQAAQGTKTVASAFAGGIVNNAAERRQTDMMPLRIDGAINFQNARKALSRISGEQGQGYRDYAMGINQTAGAMGGEEGEAFMSRVGGADFLKSLSKAGIGTKEFNALSLRGQQQMGSQFNEKQIFDATKLEERGYGTADQNMLRMGTLASASGQGDSAANLGRIIEESMKRGLNSSKALDMIVENTAKFAEAGMMAGVRADPSTGIATAILRAVDQSNPNKEQALALAMQGFERAEAAQTNTDASLSGFQNVDRNMKIFGVDRKSSGILTKMSTAEVAELRAISQMKNKDGTPISDDRKRELKLEAMSRRGVRTTGMNESWWEGDTLADALDQSAATGILGGIEGRGILWNTSKRYKAALEGSRGDTDLTKALVFGTNRKLLQEKGLLGVYEEHNSASSVGGVNPTPINAAAAVKMKLLTQDVSDKELKDLISSMRANAVYDDRLGRRAESGKVAVGAEAFGPTAEKAMSALAESGRIAFEKMSEKAWSQAANKTAAAFGDSSTLMGSAASKLENAADAMLTNTQLMSASGATFAKAVSDAIGNIAAKLGMIETKAPTSGSGESPVIARVREGLGGSSAPPPMPPKPPRLGQGTRAANSTEPEIQWNK